MEGIRVPAEGRPTEAVGSDTLVGLDGNAFAIMGFVARELKRAGASATFVAAYRTEATAGDYDHLLQASMAYLDAEAE